MIRHGASWITNIKQGARAKAAIASQELIDLAVRSTSCIGADYAGVDIIQAQDGAILVLEVNSMPAWNGLQAVSRRTSPTISSRRFSTPPGRDPPERPRGRLSRTSKLNPVAQAFHDACLAELDALKPGNVHRLGEDKRMSVADFESRCGRRRSRDRTVWPWRRAADWSRHRGDESGGRAQHKSRHRAAGSPFASALDRKHDDLRTRLGEVLDALTVEDARETYRAIRMAEPGGLGAATEHDVAAEPDVTLLEAMRAAELRDRIAWNYTHGYVDIFDLGLLRFRQARERWVRRRRSP